MLNPLDQYFIRPPWTVVPDGLLFYCRCFFCFATRFPSSLNEKFRHSFSELPRPIALKLCHMVGIWLNFIIRLQKFGGRSPKKIWGPKNAKFRSILDHFRLWPRISPELGNISKIGQTEIPPAFDEKSPVNFGPPTAWNYMWVWTH